MQERSSKSGLFLMELIIVIMFFSLASAITVQIFVNSHKVNHHSVDLSHASIELQNMAEIFRGFDGDYNKILALYDDQAVTQASSFILYYDKDWNPISYFESDGYQIQAIYQEESSMHSLLLSASTNKDEQMILSFQVDQYSEMEVSP